MARLTQNKETLEALHLKIAALYETQLNDPSQALLQYQIAYSLNPQNIKTVRGMRNLFQKQNRWSETIEMYEREATLQEEPAKRPAIYLKIGDIWTDEMKVPHKALESYSRVLAQGFHRPTAEKMMKLQQEVGDHRGLAEVMERELRAAGTKAEDLLGKLLKLAEIYWKKINDFSNAARVFDVALTQDKQNRLALDALEFLFNELKQFEPLIAILKRKLPLVTEASEKLALHRKIAEIYRSKLYWGFEAIEHYEAAMELAPQDLDIVHDLQAVYLEWAAFSKLVTAYEHEISLVQGPERIIELYHNIGELWYSKLFDENKAIAIYQKLLEFNPNDRRALEKLACLFKVQQKWPILLEILIKLAQLSQEQHDLDAEIAAQLEIGKIQRQLKHTQEAIAAFQRVMELEEYNAEAFTALEELYQGQKSYREMVEILEEKALKVAEPEAKLNIYLMLGKIYEENIKDPAAACRSFEKVLEFQRDHKAALKALHHLYQTTQQSLQMSRILQRELEFSQDANETAELCFQLANLYANELGNSKQAYTYLHQAIESCPKHSRSLIQLADMAESEGKYKEALDYLQKAVEHTPDFHERYRMYVRLGKIYGERLQNLTESIAMYQAAMRMDPHDPDAPAALAEIYHGQMQWEALEDLVGKFITLLAPNHPQVGIWYHRWATAAENLDKKDEAISRYITAMKLAPKHLPTLLALGPLHVEKEQWQEAWQCFQEAYAHPELRDKTKVLSQLGMIEEKLGKYQEAMEHYQQLLSVHPEDTQAMYALAKVTMQLEKYDESLGFFQQALTTSEDDEFKCTVRKDKAGLLHKVGKTHDAITEYVRVFEYNPQDSSVILALCTLYSKIKDWEQAEHWNQQHYQLIQDVQSKVENRCKYAIILSEGMKKYDEALASYQEALALDPTCLAAIEGIGKIYVMLKDWQSLANSYQNFLSKLPTDKRPIGFPIHIALGHLLAEQLNDKAGAAREFEKALELVPNHVEAQIALTEIKSGTAETRQDAVKGHLKLLQRDQFRTASYRALGKLLIAEGQKDRAMRAYRALQIFEPAALQDCPLTSQLATKMLGTEIPENAIAQNIVPSRVIPLFELMALTDDSQQKNLSTIH